MSGWCRPPIGQGPRAATRCWWVRWSWRHHPLVPLGREGRADPGTDRAMLILRLLRHAGGMTTVAEFLRARRDQLQPSDVGLPDNGRRRSPGLRREEVAALAGVSIDYLVRLEQGRDTRPSPSVIAALADALRLDDDQRRQLYTLAMVSQTSELCPAARPLPRVVAPTVLALLKGLGTTPAFVSGPANDVLAWNDAWEHLVRPLG